LVAFVAEYRRGARRRRRQHVWLQCSCRELIMQPETERPRAAPAAT